MAVKTFALIPRDPSSAIVAMAFSLTLTEKDAQVMPPLLNLMKYIARFLCSRRYQ